MMRCAVVLFVVALSFGSTGIAGQPAGSLKGRFASKDLSFPVEGGVAFTGKSSLDRQTPVILVAVTNTSLNTAVVADFVDRKRAIDHLLKDDETPIVYLEFTPEGRWRGVSYFLAPGNGCMFCSSEVASAVKLVKGRLTGSVKGTEKDRPFNVEMDIAVLSDEHGQALPADGGAPGKAYLAYHAALVKQDATALRATLSPGNLEVFAGAQKKNSVAGYVEYLADKHPIRSVKIMRGWSNAEKASLLVEGENGVGNVAGEVLLINAKGVWGVDEELVDLVIGK